MSRLENILFVLKKRKYALIAIAIFLLFGFLYSFFLGLIKIPIINIQLIRMLPINIFDIVFIFIFSIMISITFTLYIYKSKNKKIDRIKETTTVSAGFVMGFITSMCPFCPLILFSLFGSSITLSFLAPYYSLFKFLSIALLGVAIFFVSGDIRNKCSCKKLKK